MLALCFMLSTTYYAQNYVGIIGVGLAVVSIMGNFLSTAQKHNRKMFEHNRLGPNR